ncbi:hypothetical protein BCV70DRAFT_7750 [Testicularia cyperi]|uniref:Uncharacterized protein n=1 Tax=Testicularia cyperi TaxID=1882483 RepID=A0A317Y020_9BASI|nr:hypothetical protein BCV70DRAFT_7750 [Testicularia cyperi]
MKAFWLRAYHTGEYGNIAVMKRRTDQPVDPLASRDRSALMSSLRNFRAASDCRLAMQGLCRADSRANPATAQSNHLTFGIWLASSRHVAIGMVIDSVLLSSRHGYAQAGDGEGSRGLQRAPSVVWPVPLMLGRTKRYGRRSDRRVCIRGSAGTLLSLSNTVPSTVLGPPLTS